VLGVPCKHPPFEESGGDAPSRVACDAARGYFTTALYWRKQRPVEKHTVGGKGRDLMLEPCRASQGRSQPRDCQGSKVKVKATDTACL